MTDKYCCPAQVLSQNIVEPSQKTLQICNSFHVSKKPKYTFEFANIMIGDLIVFMSDGMVSKLIEKYIETKSERTKYTHVAIYIGNGRIVHNNPYYKKIEFNSYKPRIVSGVNCDILADKENSQKMVRCFRFRNLSDCDRSSIAQNASQRIEEPYDIFPAFYSYILKQTNFSEINLQNKFHINNKTIKEISSLSNVCSTFVEEVFCDSIGDRFPIIGDEKLQFSMPYDFVISSAFEEIDLSVTEIA